MADHTAQSRTVLGIDIGGTGIKGAPVEVATGALVAERFRLPTPQPATPAAVAEVAAQVAAHFSWTGPVGACIPSVVVDGVARTAANVDPAWIGTDAAELLGAAVGRPVSVLNDADAAGLAEMAFGSARGRRGVALVLTLGTGIGSALFHDGVLVPNTELGHMDVAGTEAEHLASGTVRDRDGLSWKGYAKRLQVVLDAYDAVLWPDLIVLGGGVSKHADQFLHRLSVRPEVAVATLRNSAGIVGAALRRAAAG